MSYEPTLIVSYEDLVRVDKEMDYTISCPREGYDPQNIESRVIFELMGVLDSKPVEFLGVKFYIFQPEFTSFNASVRGWLDEHEVRYTIDY